VLKENNKEIPIIEYVKKNSLYIFRYKPHRKPKAISGHRFVDLLVNNRYSSKLKTLMGFYDLTPEIDKTNKDEAKYIIAGEVLEEEVIKLFSNDYVKYEFSKDNKGDMFNYNHKFMNDDVNFNGLIDGELLDLDCLVEVKNYSNPQKVEFGCPQEWFLQARLYLYLWNITAEKYGRKKYDKIIVLAHHMDRATIDYVWKFKASPKLDKDNVLVYEFYDVEDNFEELVDYSLIKRLEVLATNEEGYIEVKEEYTGKDKEELENLITQCESQGKCVFKKLGKFPTYDEEGKEYPF